MDALESFVSFQLWGESWCEFVSFPQVKSWYRFHQPGVFPGKKKTGSFFAAKSYSLLEIGG